MSYRWEGSTSSAISPISAFDVVAQNIKIWGTTFESSLNAFKRSPTIERGKCFNSQPFSYLRLFPLFRSQTNLASCRLHRCLYFPFFIEFDFIHASRDLWCYQRTLTPSPSTFIINAQKRYWTLKTYWTTPSKCRQSLSRVRETFRQTETFFLANYCVCILLLASKACT